MPEDATLLHRYAETRAEDAFAELVRRHVDAVYSAALRRVGGDTHLAEDVTQQVFVALAGRAAIVARHPALTSWLYVATRNEAANAVRTERRRKTREQESLTMQESASDQSPNADWSRVAPLIDGEIDRLSERDRTALLLRFIEDRPFAEIGAVLQLTEDAARMRVDRALEKLRVSLARRGIVSTSAALGVALVNHAAAAAPASVAASATMSAIAAATITTGTSAVGFLQLMTSAKLASSVVGIVLVLATFGVATYEIHRARDTSAALMTARQNESALAVRLRTLTEQTNAAESETAHLSQQFHDAEAAAAEASRRAAASAAKIAAWNPTAEGNAFLERHPEVRQALVDWGNAQINYDWSAFYEEAGLTRAQIAEFQKLRSEGQWFGRSALPGMQQLNFKLGSGIPWSETEAKLRALLGTDGYQKYQSYFQTLPARQLGAQAASALAFTTTPLTAGQYNQLVHAITNSHSAGYNQSGAYYDWPAITKSAQEILSPAQRTVLDGLRAQAEFDQAFSQAAMAQRRPQLTAATAPSK